MELLDIDEIQATAILDMQLRRLAALERQKIIDELAEIELEIADSQGHPGQARAAAADHLATSSPRSSTKYGDDRRTRIVPYDGDVSMEDLIAARGRGRHHHPDRVRQAHQDRPLPLAAARRQGRRRARTLKQDDIVGHFFVCSTHDWILFFTNKGRVYRAKAYELPEANRIARGQHVANLLAFQPDEQIAQVIQIRNYEVAPYLVLATKERAGEEDPS